MTVYYATVTALIDPEQYDPVIGGGKLQDVTMVLSGNYGQTYGERPPERPAAITLTPGDARELAFDLLMLAEQADQMSSRR